MGYITSQFLLAEATRSSPKRKISSHESYPVDKFLLYNWLLSVKVPVACQSGSWSHPVATFGNWKDDSGDLFIYCRALTLGILDSFFEIKTIQSPRMSHVYQFFCFYSWWWCLKSDIYLLLCLVFHLFLAQTLTTYVFSPQIQNDLC